VRAGGAVQELAAPPPLNAGGPSGPVSMAVVGLTPSADLPKPPEGAREARFSGGPTVRAQGGDGEPVESARVFVPGLMVRNGAPAPADPMLIARAAPVTSPENLRRILREAQPAAEPVPAAAGVAVRVTAPPDPILAGRTVYGMTVQMPNITSFSGSWLIWFSERDERPGAPGAVEPPVPLHKVDPKYVASAMDERIEGKVRLAAVILADGRVGPVMLLRRLDSRLDATAMEALGRWQFQPARRNGVPVEVDAVVEIPFRLAPREAR
jgi:TonB family protein